MLSQNRGNKFIVFSIIFFLFIIPLVSSATNVVVTQPTPKKPSFFETYFGFLTQAWFWYIVLGFLVIVAILIGLFFLVRWIVKFIKSRNSLYYLLRMERMKLASVHSRYKSNHFYHVHKNTPIRLVRNVDRKLHISEPFAYHRGDFVSHDGQLNISMNLVGDKKWFIFPVKSLLVIPDKDSVEVQVRDEKGKQKTTIIAGLPRASQIVQFNQREILLFIESVSQVGLFYIPVLKTKDGKILDLSLPVFQSFKEVAVGDYLYQQSADFVDIAKKSIAINPNLNYEVKSRDANQNVDIPSDKRS